MFAKYSAPVMRYRPRIFAGAQILKLRGDRGLSQGTLAQMLSISPSYLSQLEHDDRPLTPRLAEVFAKLFPLEWQDISLDETDRLVFALREAMADPIFSDEFSPDALVKIAEQQPEFARRFIELQASHRRTSQRLELVDEAISVDRAEGSRLPWEEVRDWFHLSNNYVDQLDRAAELLAERLTQEFGQMTAAAMCRHLEDRHGIQVAIEAGNDLRHFDPAAAILRINAGQPDSGIRFQLAYHIATSSLHAEIDDIARSAHLKTTTARELLKVGLANYAAGAVLMPYEAFRRAAREVRHDIERIMPLFGTSFEQTCHRLSTLQREGARGLPVFFCRLDMAGNITKRHSATKLQFARFGGACPLWIAHEAVAIPDRILVQLAETPDGVRYVSMAKGRIKASGRFDRHPRRYAVALGCEVKHANDFVYADSIDLTSSQAVTPIGVSCRICSRVNCDQRAYPPSDQMIAVDHHSRGFVPYRLDRPA